MSSHSAVVAQDLGFSFDSSVEPVFEGLTFHLTAGWTGLVGANGSGKTTLLRLIRGELRATDGLLRLEPDEARVVWCPQRVETHEGLSDFYDAQDRLAHRWRARLKLDEDAFARWDTLSPGERKRWQLGAALWSEPDVLLLDEPGNHLDVEGLELLRESLRSFRGVGVLVSHDRALLDDVTSATLRLHGGEARLWPLAFSAAREAWEGEATRTRESQRELKKRLEREAERLTEKRDTLRSSTKQRNTGARMRNKHDGDARTLGADFRAAQAEIQHAKALRRTERKADAVQAALDEVHVHDDAGSALFLHFEASPKATVLQFRGDVEHVRAKDVTVQLGRGEHLWLRGPNGAGKTSLLTELLKRCDVPEERRLVLPQELTARDAFDDLEAVKALPNDVRGRVLQLVHALGVEPDQLLRTENPSPGEARKLRLALGLGKHVWLAALDEPTNHLDLPAIERLETALAAFPGALLLITHDERLGERVTTRRLDLG
ncbi:MAG: ATP-binding cassette domain-containing protein [Archangium sp.]